MAMSSRQFGSVRTGLWWDPVDRRLVLEVIRKLSNPRDPKGVSGLIADFQEKGLGGKIASWIDPDVQSEAKVEITADDIKKVLGPNVIKEFAKEVKETPEEVSYRLSRIVPRLANQLLVAGEIPSKDVEMVGLEAIRSDLLLNR